MFEGESAHTWTGKFPVMSMGGRAEGLAREDLVVSGNSKTFQCFRLSLHLQYDYQELHTRRLALVRLNQVVLQFD